MLYRSINLGKTQRREYYHLNRSDLFRSLPHKDLTQEQKESYQYFRQEALPSLFNFYFPAQFGDYNNQIRLEISDFRFEEPKFSEAEAYRRKITRAEKIFLTWLIAWTCQTEGIQFDTDKTKTLAENLHEWIKSSFATGNFSLELKEENKLKKESKWEVNAEQLKIILWISPSEIPDRLVIKFYYERKKEVPFCVLPKMTKQGSFIINGNDRVIVFQSVRAPNVYFFEDHENKSPLGEIIPFKGPWIRIFLDNLNPRTKQEVKLGIKLKFLNTGATFDLTQILAETSFSGETLLNLFGSEEIIENSLQLGKSEKKASDKTIPKFLFNEKNSYFLLGELGRQKFNRKMNILRRLKGQTLAENLKDKEGKLIFSAGTFLSEEKISVIRDSIQEKRLPFIVFEGYQLYSLAVISPNFPQKKANILGPTEENSQKTWFDWGDLVVVFSYFFNLQHGIGKVEKEEVEKDSLENQMIRRVGDLLYNIFDNKFGAFKQTIESKYLANISQLKKADPTKLPKIQEFNGEVKKFFHSSTLAQLQNENNTLARASHILKVSRLGLGGSNLTNVSPGTRDIDPSYEGRYCPSETPEGQKIGLVHSLTLNAMIDKHGQILAPYYLVKQGKIIPEIAYLTAEEESEKYIAHCDIKINEDNLIEEDLVWTRFQRKFCLVPKEKVNFIYTSFYQLNSVNSSSIPFFHHNDSVRMLTASNMQKQAVTLLRGEAPLVASGVENYLLNNDFLTIKADSAGIVEYVDSEKIIIHSPSGKNAQQRKDNFPDQVYSINQFLVTNANSLLTSTPLVKKGEKVEAGQVIACGSYHDQQELALGHNLRVAFMCWKGYNYEDAIVVNERLIKEDILTSLFAKKYIIIRKRLKIDKKPKEEEFYSRPDVSHLDEEGIVKLGSIVRENDILVSKRTPYKKQQTEELLLASILGEEAYSFADSSFRLPRGEKESIVYEINRWQKEEIYQRGSGSYKEDDLEVIEIGVVQKRKIEAGDKLTTRFGNKGVVGKIVPEIDMPFDEDGKAVDIIFNPLSVPSRMNIGQLIEVLLGSVAYQTKTKLLVRPFNTPNWEQIAKIVEESGLKNYGLTQLYDGQTSLPFDQKVLVGYIYTIKLNHMVADKFHARNTGPYALVHQQPVKGRAHGGGQRVGEMEAWALEAHGAAYNLLEMMGAKSDDLHLRRLIQHSLIFSDRELTIRSNQSESFNLLLQYLRAVGFDLTAQDYQGKEIDFYKQFSRTSQV